MVRMMVQLTEEQVKALKELAKARKTPVAKLVRESVAQYVAVSESGAKREEARLRALKFIQDIKDGKYVALDIEDKTDVSANHDEYFAQAIEDDLR
ncbi:MAG: hypothetical protein HKUEN02_05260 [Anaerolineaceae bacterium]|nr:MAG: hypothetical protein HKUEN02_05260 [Anaerolineaceae bacterium]